MDGTVHLAVGAGLGFTGGLNRSAVHWDMVKELRHGRADRARRRRRPGERRMGALDPRVARVRAAAGRALARRAARLAGADPDAARGAAAGRGADPADRGGAARYPLLRMNFTLFPVDEVWAAEAPLELVGEIAPIDLYASDHMDARITSRRPTTPAARRRAERRAPGADEEGAQAPFFRRTMADEIPWVGCQFPTNAFAQEAGMPLARVRGLLLRRVPARLGRGVASRCTRCCARFDAADEVRIVGAETDLTPVAARAQGRGRRRPREHARRRVLLLAERGLRRGDDPTSTSRPSSTPRRSRGSG